MKNLHLILEQNKNILTHNIHVFQQHIFTATQNFLHTQNNFIHLPYSSKIQLYIFPEYRPLLLKIFTSADY